MLHNITSPTYAHILFCCAQVKYMYDDEEQDGQLAQQPHSASKSSGNAHHNADKGSVENGSDLGANPTNLGFDYDNIYGELGTFLVCA